MSSEISIAGGWLGTYAYKGVLQGQSPVRFEARFDTNDAGDDQFTGTILDDCRLGEAIVDGVTSGRTVKFTKTYRAKKARSGVIEYQGLLSEDGKQITGTWRLGMAQGVWEAQRSWQEEHEPEAVSETLWQSHDLDDALIETARR